MQYIKQAIDSTSELSKNTERTVKEILKSIEENGDSAVMEYERKFGNSTRESLLINKKELERAISLLSNEEKQLIETVVKRVTKFAEAQLECLSPLDQEFGSGIKMGHRIIPIEKVGAYVPGGRFPLLSSGPMVTVPAKVAGAERIVVCSPANYKGSIHPAVLYGLKLSGATDIYAIGGAQAIGAMAYGTETMPQVDVIAGPGNRFVAEAKRQVFGEVGIDMIAGPSEVIVISDEGSSPKLCAADLLAQAEHDPNAKAILISTSKQQAEETLIQINEILNSFSEKSAAHESWNKMGEIIIAKDLDEAIKLSNDIAGEHLHLHLKNSKEVEKKLYNYGSLFVNENSSVVFSDKVSGTNHTLPTNRAGRYTGGLWVGSYLKVITYQEISGEGINYLAAHATKQSEIEGLEGHRLSAALRLDQ